MATKKIQLRGISRTPSDRMSEDGGCAESLNMYLNRNELAPMPDLKDITEQLELPTDKLAEVVYIHKTEEYTNYILQEGNKIVNYKYAGDEGKEYNNASANEGNSIIYIRLLDTELVPNDGDRIHIGDKLYPVVFSQDAPYSPVYYFPFNPDSPEDVKDYHEYEYRFFAEAAVHVEDPYIIISLQEEEEPPVAGQYIVIDNIAYLVDHVTQGSMFWLAYFDPESGVFDYPLPLQYHNYESVHLDPFNNKIFIWPSTNESIARPGEYVRYTSASHGDKLYRVSQRHVELSYSSQDVINYGDLIPFYTLEEGETLKQIASVGNTLTILTSMRMIYVLYNESKYRALGDHIPMPKIKVEGVNYDTTVAPYNTMHTEIAWQLTSSNYDSSYEVLKNDITENELSANQTTLARNINVAWNRIKLALLEIINVNTNINHGLNALSMPVMIRYAVKLYDGTYVNHSAPILIDPYKFARAEMFSDTNSQIRFHYDKQYAPATIGLEQWNGPYQGKMFDMLKPYFLKFTFDLMSEFDGWRDIVSCVDIFMSTEINRFNLSICKITNYHYDGIQAESSRIWMKPLTTGEREEQLTNASNFYLIQSIDFEDYLEISAPIEYKTFADKTADKLVTLPKLPDDVPCSNDKINPNGIMAYNERICINGYKLEHFDGYHQAPSSVPVDSADDDETYIVKHSIITPSGKECITNKLYDGDKPGPWMFYPNNNCKRITVYRRIGDYTTTDNYKTESVMKEHPLLNGSYCFKGWGGESAWEGESTEDTTEQMYYSNVDEYRPNTILQGKASNPFIFENESRFTGKILDVSTITKPLSTGQFGYSSLYIFTSEGLFSLATNTDGSFGKTDIVSHDVALKDTICQLDQAVIFTTKRGVMLLTGSDIKCISDKMTGKHYTLSCVPQELEDDAIWGDLANMLMPEGGQMTFNDFIKDARTLYDYANQRLILFHKPEAGTPLPYAYVYMLDTDSWHKMSLPDGYTFGRLLNSYPEAYITARLTDGSGTSMRVLECSTIANPELTEATDRRPGVIVTRPLYLDTDDVRKTISHLFVRGTYIKGNVKYILQGSMDGQNWQLLTSLNGASYKLFRIVVLSNLLPAERISDIEVDYHLRFNSRIR